jgi:hypothetical protein
VESLAAGVQLEVCPDPELLVDVAPLLPELPELDPEPLPEPPEEPVQLPPRPLHELPPSKDPPDVLTVQDAMAKARARNDGILTANRLITGFSCWNSLIKAHPLI